MRKVNLHINGERVGEDNPTARIFNEVFNAPPTGIGFAEEVACPTCGGTRPTCCRCPRSPTDVLYTTKVIFKTPVEEIAQLAYEFVIAYEVACEAERSAQLFPKDVIIADMRRLESTAKEKYAALKRAVTGEVKTTGVA